MVPLEFELPRDCVFQATTRAYQKSQIWLWIAIELPRKKKWRPVASVAWTWSQRSIMDKLPRQAWLEASLPHSWQANGRHIVLHTTWAQCSAIDKLLTPRAIGSIIASKQIVWSRSNCSDIPCRNESPCWPPPMTDAHLWNCMLMETLVAMQEAIWKWRQDGQLRPHFWTLSDGKTRFNLYECEPKWFCNE